MRKFYLVLVLAGLLVACGGNSASPTEAVASPTEAPTLVSTTEPTMVPTETLEPTPVPTEVPPAEPTPVPTEVPMYVGLPADQVEALRARCLQENPDSLCLPLPVDPSTVGVIQEERREVVPGIEEFNVVVELLPGARIVSPVAQQMRVYGYDTWGWYPLDRMDDRSYYVFFQWGPFRPDSSGLHGSYAPTTELSISADPPGGFSEVDPGPIGVPSLQIFGGQRDVLVGEPIAEVTGENPLYLRISSYPIAEEIYGRSMFFSRMNSLFLLRDEHGSIVYVLEQSGGEAQTEAEVYLYFQENCREVAIGSGESDLLGYAEDLLERAGFPEDSRETASLGVYPREGCVAVYYAPSAGQSVLVFESRDEGVQVINTEPFEFCYIVSQ